MNLISFTTVEEGSSSINMANYRYLGDRINILGARLDAARDALARSETAWTKQYWTQVIERLTFQWRNLPALHDGNAQVSLTPRWTVDYNFYERDDGVGHTDWVDRFIGSASVSYTHLTLPTNREV